MENPQIELFYVFTGLKNTPFCDFFRVEEQVDDLVYQENELCPIILDRICS